MSPGIMSARLVRGWDAQARRKWTPRLDPPNENLWTSSADAVVKDEAWAGNCADLTSTVLELLTRHGQPLAATFRLMVTAKGTTGPANHMVGFTWDVNGQGWIVGDTFGPCYPAEEFAHMPFRYQDLTDLAVWREGLPWAVDGAE